MAAPPSEPSDDEETERDPIQVALDEEAERNTLVALAQNTVIALLIEKLIEKDAITRGDAISLLEDCIERFENYDAKVVPQSILDLVRKNVVPPPGAH